MRKDIIIGLLLISNLISGFYLVKQNNEIGSVNLSEIEIETPRKLSLEGTYLSKDNPFYKSLTFKGQSTVVIKDKIFELDYPSSYEKDGDFIRIKTEKSDLLLKIITSDSLVGEGFAKGSFKKVKE